MTSSSAGSSASGGPVAKLIQSILDMPGEFAKIATTDPISAVLLAIGALLVVVSVAVFGYLTLGAALDLTIPDVSSDQPRREAR